MQKRQSFFRIALLSLMWSAWVMIVAMVPPHPLYVNPPDNIKPVRIEKPATHANRQKNIPNNILVLRVQFSDVQFQSTPAYPDSLAHDAVFFDRWMKHLRDFFDDASHSRYILDYHIHPQVITLPQTMAYYGNDSATRIDARSAEIIADLVTLTDAEINFSSYGGLIIFHAGAGQESDISGIRTEQLWSTFITRKDLQYYFDEENDDYPGYPTSDGALLSNIVLVPESQYQDYFPGDGEQDAPNYLFSIFGVLAHQFGHLIGLPTLFDNDSSNGRSQGIGNWGLMGTGVWNANGYVPAQLSAWSRYYLGWEDAVTIASDTEAVTVDYFLNHNPDARRLFKVPISDKEYFLIENRQQNPDGSYDPYNRPSYTFKLLPEGEQQYYPPDENNPDFPQLPYFDFMTNSYLGSEWDFFLPGLGGPVPAGYSTPIDGSGLLIWHIDENIIDANFTPNFDRNRINANASHKGIDLEEADGIQHLDTAVYDIYKYGSPYDSFRAGNNAYFGNQLINDILSLPSAESYYGGIPLEIYDISNSGNQMSFSVRFQGSLDADYEGINDLPIALIDFDRDQENEIFHPLPDGKMLMWKNDTIMPGFPIQHYPLAQLYVWDGMDIYLPTQVGNIAQLHKLSAPSNFNLVKRFIGYEWATHPVRSMDYLICPFSSDSDNSTLIGLPLRENAEGFELSLNGRIATNLVYITNTVYALTYHPDLGYVLNHNGIESYDGRGFQLLPIPADSTVISMAMSKRSTPYFSLKLYVQTTSEVYMFDLDNSLGWVLEEGFPVIYDLKAAAPMSIQDVTRNSYHDILIGGENGFVAIDYAGKFITPSTLSLSAPDSLGIAAGVLALDMDDDGKMDIVGNFSRNRLSAWGDNNRLKSSFPVSYPNRSRVLPVIGTAHDAKVYVYTSTDNGKIYKKLLPNARKESLRNVWNTHHGNYQRTAFSHAPFGENQYQSSSVFVNGEVYIYPNPLKSIYNQKLNLNVMTSRDCDLVFSIYDISGNLVYTQKGKTKAYLRNREVIDIPHSKLSSGVYVAVVLANGESKILKFAVEK